MRFPVVDSAVREPEKVRKRVRRRPTEGDIFAVVRHLLICNVWGINWPSYEVVQQVEPRNRQRN